MCNSVYIDIIPSYSIMKINSELSELTLNQQESQLKLKASDYNSSIDQKSNKNGSNSSPMLRNKNSNRSNKKERSQQVSSSINSIFDNKTEKQDPKQLTATSREAISHEEFVSMSTQPTDLPVKNILQLIWFFKNLF